MEEVARRGCRTKVRARQRLLISIRSPWRVICTRSQGASSASATRHAAKHTAQKNSDLVIGHPLCSQKVAPCSFAVKESGELTPRKPLAPNASKVTGTAKLLRLAAITVSSTRPSCAPPYRRSLCGREVRGMEVAHQGLDIERQFRNRPLFAA